MRFSLPLALWIAATGWTQGLMAQHVTRTLDGLWRLRAIDGKRLEEPLGLDDAARRWRDVWVPSAFEQELGADFDGIVEYERSIRASRPAEGVLHRLTFSAVMTHARVFFNEHELGEHLGGWTAFSFEVPAELFVDGGTQRLRVVVDERVGHATQGFLPDIAPHFGGIWQSVSFATLEGLALDPSRVELRTSCGDGVGRVTVEWSDEPVHRRAADERGRVTVDVGLMQGEREIPVRVVRRERDAALHRTILELRNPRTWSPENPSGYTAHVRLIRDGDVVDSFRREIAFCRIDAKGREIHVGGAPRVLRGLLHWGYAPPRFAPNPPDGYWREEMRFAKAAGFDMIKACLWLPPPRFFELALEEGLFVWVEYPAWHPDFSAKNREPLLREYGEFFRADRVWPHVIARSLTCETGRGSADAGVIEALFRECKRATGGVLVEDDSSWISWNRFHDFYDDHPYGNPHDWVGRLEGFDRYIEDKGAKPLILGEAFAGDTWVDLERLRTLLGSLSDASGPWWQPYALDSMQRFERELAARDGRGAAAALVPDSKRQAMRLRKYQLESFRRVLPRAGYTVSVMRDFRRARMGFFDDCGDPKWSAQDFAWHGAHMLVLADPRPIRSLTLGEAQGFVPRLALAGRLPEGASRFSVGRSLEISDASGERVLLRNSSRGKSTIDSRSPLLALLSTPVDLGGLRANLPNRPVRVRAEVTLDGVGDEELRNSWDFWAFPEDASDVAVPDGVRVATTMDPATLQWVEDGGRLLLQPGKGAPAQRGLWFLEGAAYGPTEHALFEKLPRALLHDLQAFDLHGPVFRSNALTDAFDVVLGYWDTHDEREVVQRYGLLLEAAVGRGRIVLCALGLGTQPEPGFDASEKWGGAEQPARANPARAWLRTTLLDHLATGATPRVKLPATMIRRWHDAMRAEIVALDGAWRLRADPERKGVAQEWHSGKLDDAWLVSRAGAHWEAQGLPHYTGQAWYRKDFTPPLTWKPGQALWLVCDGVDDSYEVFVNGASIASHGDEKTGETVWLVRTSTDIGGAVVPGTNTLALRVVDHQGAGGLHRPVRLSTVRPEKESLLQER